MVQFPLRGKTALVAGGSLGPRGITVNAISPGPTEAGMMQDQNRDKAAAMSPSNPIGDPRDVAEIGVVLASDAACWVTGQRAF